MGFDFNNKKQNIETKKISYAPAKRHLARWQWYLLVLIIISPLLYFSTKAILQHVIVTASGYVHYNKIMLRAPEDGYIDQIASRVGDHVIKGEPVIQMHSPATLEILKHLRGELERLVFLKKETPNPAIVPLQQMKQKGIKYLDRMIDYLETMEDLRRKGLSNIMLTHQAVRDLKDLQLEIGGMNRDIAVSGLDHRFKLENQYDKRITDLKREVIKLEVILRSMIIKAPKSGSVLKVFVGEQEFVPKGQSLMEIATRENLQIRVYLSHKFMSKEIQEGKIVTVVFPDNIKIEGKISKIPNLAEHQDKFANIIRAEKNKVLLIIKLLGKLPEKYAIYGLPVKVYM